MEFPPLEAIKNADGSITVRYQRPKEERPKYPAPPKKKKSLWCKILDVILFWR